MELTGKIHSFESFGTLDGPGIRFVVFLQGCLLRCKYCHNPDTWARDGGQVFTVAKIMRRIEACRNYLSNGGVTLSGGEPLLQADFALALLTACRQAGFHTALDTAGSLPLAQTAPVIDRADLLLLDIKSLDSEQCRQLTGQDNQNELATLAYCEEQGKPVWIRQVLLPNWTLSQTYLQNLAAFLRPHKCVKRVDLLPFHQMAEFKWQGLGLTNPLSGIAEPTAEAVQTAEAWFQAAFTGC